jgi:DUF971 family protein
MAGASIMNLPVLMRKIQQKTNFSFEIEWSDGSICEYRLSDLQKKCPCAGCLDSETGARLNTVSSSEVKALKIRNVGRYAIAIQFTSGCSKGIYDYSLLRKIAVES